MPEIVKGFPAYTDSDKGYEEAQTEYREFVIDYFNKYNIQFAPEMQIHYTPCSISEVSSRYQLVCGEKLPDGSWKKVGIWTSGTGYFCGDEKRGYLLDANVMRIWDRYDAIPYVYRDNIRSLNLPRQEVLQYAIFATYFKVMLIPDDARAVGGNPIQ